MAFFLKLLDVRRAELRPVLATFGSLFFIVVAHTLLETARDAMFLRYVGPAALGYMYIITAVLTLIVGALSSRLVALFGARRALVAGQLTSAAGAAAFFFLPPTAPDLTGLYAFSVVSGVLLVPQLWVTAAALFHAGQGRRLFGTIAIAGVLGAVVGSSAGAGALLVADVHWLLLASAAAFATSAAFIGLAPRARALPAAEPAGPAGSWWGAFREEPALRRVALVVALGAATVLFADYLFKAVAAATVPPARLGSFFARYYAATNVLALAVQVLIARRVLARAGVVGAVGMMPSLMFLGSVLGFVTGGSLFAVLGTKAVDGALRHSVQRTSLELVYLAVPPAARGRARPIIDGALTRVTQAAAAGLVLLLAWRGHGSTRELAFLTTCAAAAWLAAAVSLRGPYVELFRRALLGPEGAEQRSPEELDLASVEILVEALSSPRPREAAAAIGALARRGRAGLVPALVLLREEEDVLECAFETFAPLPRSDWVRFAEARLSDPRERVRRFAMRALARAHRTPGGEARERAAVAERPWVRGYLAADAFVGGTAEPAELVRALPPDEDRRETRLGMLTALADASPAPRLAAALQGLVEGAAEPLDAETVELIARAAAAVRAAPLAPWLVARLEHRDARPAVRAALSALGTPALGRLGNALTDPETPRRLRAHAAAALAEFGTQEAADRLFDYLREGADGFVRYRCLVALERMTTDGAARLAERKVRALVRRELDEHFRLLALSYALEQTPSPPPPGTSHDLLLRLLAEKCAFALVRVFRLLKLCLPNENLRQVEVAIASGDPVRRANAAEFLDGLLAPRRRQRDDGVRALLRLVTEDLPDGERVERAAEFARVRTGSEPRAALDALRKDGDVALAALAASADQELSPELAAAGRARPSAPPDKNLPGFLSPAEAHGR